MKLLEWMQKNNVGIDTDDGKDRLEGGVSKKLHVNGDGTISVSAFWWKDIGGAYESKGKEIYRGMDEEAAVRVLENKVHP